MSAPLHVLLEVPLAYLYLGLNEEAWAELDAVPSEFQVHPSVYGLRIEILQKLEKWEPARVLAESLAGSFPEDAGWWLSWAYAARRETSVEAARDVLRQALEFHAEVGHIVYNLACYLCVLGEVDEARGLLPKAFVLEPQLKKEAVTDPDLVTIFGSGLGPDDLVPGPPLS